MRTLLLITAKDLRQRLHDRSAYLFGIVVPLGLAVLFSLIIPGFGEGEVTVRIAVADLDGGELAGEFVTALDDIDVVEEVTALERASAVEAAVDTGEADAGFVVPAGFSTDVIRGRGSSLRVVADPDEAIERLVATSIAEGFAARVDTAATAVATIAAATGRTPPRDVVQAAARRAVSRGPAIELVDGTIASRQLDATTYLAAGMAVFFLFFTVQFGVISLLEERENGTFDRLLAAPVRRPAVYGAKMLTSIVLGLVSMTVLIVASAVLLGATWGDPLGVGLLVVTGVLAASGIVAVVAVLARTAEQAGVWQSIIAIVLGMLGGSFFPLTQGPEVLLEVAKISPHHWFLHGLGALQAGGGVGASVPAAGALSAFAVGAVLLAGVLPSRDPA